MDRESELALVGRLRAEDREAFDQLYRAFNDRLFGFLVRLSGNRETAEDLVEETWLRVVIHASRLRPDTMLAPWLFRIARNIYYSYCRSRRLETGLAIDLVGLWLLAPQLPSPLESASASEMQQRIESALASLPAASREVLLLVGVEGLEPAEAAAVCGITAEAFRQRLHRARLLLASRLERSQSAAVSRMSEATT